MKYVIEFDLPDNDTVLNNIKTAWVGWNVWGYSGIAHAKPKQPERKTGKWIDKGWNGDWQYQMDGRGMSWHEWQCSECNHITKGAKWPFCPNCGADMREEGEQE